LLGLSLLLVTATAGDSKAAIWWPWRGRQAFAPAFCVPGPCVADDGPPWQEVGGTWYWVRSPEEEKRVIMGLFNRYCIRCHGIDGRGVWDIPDVPNFANAHWQASRSDGQLARAILEGRGAVMPPWRGTLSLEEAWAMARYLRTLVPGTEKSRPDYGQPEKPAGGPQTPAPGAGEGAPK
jgi:mono/diheme cytochrome c family protein